MSHHLLLRAGASIAHRATALGMLCTPDGASLSGVERIDVCVDSADVEPDKIRLTVTLQANLELVSEQELKEKSADERVDHRDRG